MTARPFGAAHVRWIRFVYGRH